MEIAAAVAIVDSFIVPAKNAHDALLSLGLHSDVGERDADGFVVFAWMPSAINQIADLSVPEDIDAAAHTAYPDDAESILNIASSVSDAKVLLPNLQSGEWDEAEQTAADRAMNRFFVAINKCAKLLPHARAAT